MGTASSTSGFMTDESPAASLPPEEDSSVVEERQMVGYRIRERKTPGKVSAEEGGEGKQRRDLRERIADRLHRLIDYAFVLLYGLLGIRLLLVMAAANPEAGFVKFVHAVTRPFYAPFVDIVPSPALASGNFELPIVICMLAYLLLHLAIRELLHLILATRQA